MDHICDLSKLKKKRYIFIPVVPHKAVAEVSSGRDVLLLLLCPWCPRKLLGVFAAQADPASPKFGEGLGDSFPLVCRGGSSSYDPGMNADPYGTCLWTVHASCLFLSLLKNRKPIGELGCCESGMAERSH